jgi:hypothetical protein
MRYLKVSWIHPFVEEPVLLYSEINEDNFEVRKIEIYQDDSFGIASETKEFGGTALGIDKIPPLEEIRTDTQFLPSEISKAEFEDVWREYSNFLK